MSEPIQVALITLFGVLIGSALTLIPNLIERNREKIKFQRDIYEAKLTRLEKYIEDFSIFIRNYDYKNKPIAMIQEKVDGMIIFMGFITDDYGVRTALIEFMRNIRIFLDEGINQARKAEDRIDVSKLNGSCLELLNQIDKFRLNDYKPRKKPLNKMISDWWTKRKFLKFQSPRSK